MKAEENDVIATLDIAIAQHSLFAFYLRWQRFVPSYDSSKLNSMRGRAYSEPWN